MNLSKLLQNSEKLTSSALAFAFTTPKGVVVKANRLNDA
jgi:hypothetical protein